MSDVECVLLQRVPTIILFDCCGITCLVGMVRTRLLRFIALSVLKLNDIVKSSHMRKHYKHHVGAANFLFLFFFAGGVLYVCLGIELIFFLSLAGMRHSMTSLIVGVLEVACFAAFPCSHLYLPYRTDEQ